MNDLLHRQPEILGAGPISSHLSDLISVHMRRVDIILTRAFSSAELNVKSGVTVCLGLIADQPGISQKDLSQHIGSDKSIIASVVSALMESGWVVRERATVRRRQYALFLTREGEQELARLIAVTKRIEDELLAAVDPEELQTLCRILERMHASCIETLSRSSPEVVEAEPTERLVEVSANY